MRSVGAVVACVLGLSAAATGAPSPAPPRLEGTWTVSMRFVVAEGLGDRTVGQRVVERWAFRPRCAKGGCAVELRRAGRTLVLRRSGSRYRGTRSFQGAFFCNGRTYARGTTFVETWTVNVLRSGPGPRGRRALAIDGVGATVGRSSDAMPCPTVVSREGVKLRGTLDRR